MQSFRTPLQVLAFDPAPASIRCIAQMGCQLHFITPLDSSATSPAATFWLPAASVQKIVESEVARGVLAGNYDALLCWTIEQVQTAASWHLPKLFAPQCMLSTLAGVSGMALRHAGGQLQKILDGIDIVYLSDKQQENWQLDGQVVSWGLDINEFDLCDGQRREVLCVGQEGFAR